MYADLDFEALRSVDELLAGHVVVLAAMNTDLEMHETIPNAWMASVPHHQFWLFCLQQIIRKAAEDSRYAPAACFNVHTVDGRLGHGMRRQHPSLCRWCMEGLAM
jgi:mannosyltransferase OCH1-like enzyme